jgi:hypothetical protein
MSLTWNENIKEVALSFIIKTGQRVEWSDTCGDKQLCSMSEDEQYKFRNLGDRNGYRLETVILIKDYPLAIQCTN